MFVSWCLLRRSASFNGLCLWCALVIWGRDQDEFKWNVQNQPNCFLSLITAFDSLLCVFAFRYEDTLLISFTFLPGRVDWAIWGKKKTGHILLPHPHLPRQVCSLLRNEFLSKYCSASLNEEICIPIYFSNLTIYFLNLPWNFQEEDLSQHQLEFRESGCAIKGLRLFVLEKSGHWFNAIIHWDELCRGRVLICYVGWPQAPML